LNCNRNLQDSPEDRTFIPLKVLDAFARCVETLITKQSN
jgi:hypothetical protein